MKVITFKDKDKEVHVKSNCYHPIADANGKMNHCKQYHDPKEHEILAGIIGPAPFFFILCLQDEDPKIHKALTEAWNKHILLEEAVSIKKKEIENKKKEVEKAELKRKQQIEMEKLRRKNADLAHEKYNELIHFAKEHYIDI